jgi:hypothetical protein
MVNTFHYKLKMNKLFLDKAFAKQSYFKTPSLNSRSLNHHNVNQNNNNSNNSKLVNAVCDSNINSNTNSNQNNYVKQLSLNNNNINPHQPQPQPQPNTIQTNPHKKRGSTNFYSQFLQKIKADEEEEQQLQNKINIIPQRHSRQSLQHNQHHLLQVFHSNLNNKNQNSSITYSNPNNNNNLSTNESSNHTHHISKKKLNSPHVQHNYKLQHQTSNQEIILYTPVIHNTNHSRHRASISSPYCLSPAGGFSSKYPNHSNHLLMLSLNHKQSSNSSSHSNSNTHTNTNNNNVVVTNTKNDNICYEVESKLNEVQFLGPDIPLRRFVSKWEPIEKFETSNVFMFSNYGSLKNITQVVDPNTKSIINNIIITSNNNTNNNNNKANDNNNIIKNQVDVAETERKIQHFHNRSFTSNNDHMHSKVNLKTYTSVNEDNHPQKQKKKTHNKKKNKFLCCI